MTHPAAAGWYPDPQDPTLMRYWDGTRWTTQAWGKDPSDGSALQLLPNGEDRRTHAVLYLIGIAVLTFFVVGNVLNGVSPGAVFFSLIVIGVPTAIFILIVRALIRVGDKKPPPVKIVAPNVGVSPGWYPDQQDPTRLRWFDGAQWSVVTHPPQH